MRSAPTRSVRLPSGEGDGLLSVSLTCPRARPPTPHPHPHTHPRASTTSCLTCTCGTTTHCCAPPTPPGCWCPPRVRLPGGAGTGARQRSASSLPPCLPYLCAPQSAPALPPALPLTLLRAAATPSPAPAAAAASAEAELHEEFAEVKRRSPRIGRRGITVGSAAGCGMVLEDAGVQDQHARLHKCGECGLQGPRVAPL